MPLPICNKNRGVLSEIAVSENLAKPNVEVTLYNTGKARMSGSGSWGAIPQAFIGLLNPNKNPSLAGSS
jgi:hypothetical protein